MPQGINRQRRLTQLNESTLTTLQNIREQIDCAIVLTQLTLRQNAAPAGVIVPDPSHRALLAYVRKQQEPSDSGEAA